jgi:hypothetical protein
MPAGGDTRGFAAGRGRRAGTPIVTGDFRFTLLVTSADGCFDRAGYTLHVAGPSCAANVTAQVQVTLGGFRRNLVTGRWMQTVAVRNKGAAPLDGPIALVLDNLSANAALYNAAGATVCAEPLGRPYVEVNPGADGVLSPGENAAVALEFTNSNPSSAITYTPRVLAGGNQK